MEKHCKELADKLSAYLDRELSGEDLDRVNEHLDECECCRHCAETLRITRDSLRQLKKQDMPAGLKDRLKACLRENCE